MMELLLLFRRLREVILTDHDPNRSVPLYTATENFLSELSNSFPRANSWTIFLPAQKRAERLKLPPQQEYMRSALAKSLATLPKPKGRFSSLLNKMVQKKK